MRLLVLIPMLLASTHAMADPIACAGPFAADSSEARLIEAFGRDNVVTGEVPGPEGTTLIATTVFPDDPARTMEFGWWDEPARESVAYFTVPPDVTAPGGVRLGMTVDEVEALNGGPFELYGFFWDYGGTAITADGPFADLPGGCSVSFRFAVGDYPEDLDTGPISGDTPVNSTEPLLDAVDARIERITVGYPDPAATND